MPHEGHRPRPCIQGSDRSVHIGLGDGFQLRAGHRSDLRRPPLKSRLKTNAGDGECEGSGERRHEDLRPLRGARRILFFIQRF